MSSEDRYILTRDYLDNSRLNLYHYQWIEVFGYHTHPKIPIDSPNLRIADVGTGTGVWLTDLATRLPPSVQLDGLDISLHALPPREWLPPNVHVREWDMKGGVPDDLVGVYDIVHARNLAFAVTDDEIKHVLENFFKILKPGGYLQFGESDIHDGRWRVDMTNPQNKIDAHKKLIHLTLGQDPSLAFAMHQCQLIVHDLIPRKLGNEDVRKEVQRLLPEVHQETLAGACFAMPRLTVVGRKPEA
ncbi:S-adenosyl-L-methionine-dependent methyltransferase [Hypoxylon sp. FL0543]|nr:S-adenosyl-L-methionine-dependent methyltransferase [Hypoxylon sp. FL0543]